MKRGTQDAGERPQTVYRLNRKRLTATAFKAPLVAASVAAALGSAAMLFLVLIPMGVERQTDLNGWLELAAIFSMAAVSALVMGIITTYLAASPLIAAAWMLIHGLGRRGPRDLALAMGAAGFIFGAVFFGLFHGPELAMLMAPCGLISGVITGLFIHRRAYEPAPPEPGVDAAPG